MEDTDADKDATFIIDELVDATKFTLDAYRQHITAGRYTDAEACIGFAQDLTRQVHTIETYDFTLWNQNKAMEAVGGKDRVY